MLLATFWAIFLHTHLVTLDSFPIWIQVIHRYVKPKAETKDRLTYFSFLNQL
jgi:hypothetical protein